MRRIGLGEAAEVGELGRGERGRGTRLKGTSEQKLGREERRNVHVEAGFVAVLNRGSGVYGGDINSTRIAVPETLMYRRVV